MTRLVSAIYSRGPAAAEASAPEVRREAARRARAALWFELGLAVLDPEDIHCDVERQIVINLAEKAYGRRGKGR